ncbi:MAG TPA: hypothetical protein VG755_02940 [Nannocystaceae bacterium]|nr:hypothetical protein [Nannocystaceae bacterium]
MTPDSLRTALPLLVGLVLASIGCGGDDGDTTAGVGDTSSSSGGSTTTSASATTIGGESSSSTTTDASSVTTDDPADSSSDDGGSSSSGGDDPLSFAGEMNGYRWELPCADPSLRDTCAWDPALLDGALDDPQYTLHRQTLVVFGGDPNVVYDVTIQIRGVVEPKNFDGGEVQAEHFQIGGTPTIDDYNIYAIDVGDPQQRYTINRHETPHNHFLFVMDYTVTIPIRGGTGVGLEMIDPNDQAIANPGGASGQSDPFVVPDIPPAPDPFYGQFAQLDVIAVVAR